jgi:hypothetical protein
MIAFLFKIGNLILLVCMIGGHRKAITTIGSFIGNWSVGNNNTGVVRNTYASVTVCNDNTASHG